MSDEFSADLDEVRDDIELARNDLLRVVRDLSDADFDRARRGGWPVRRVLEHVIESEWSYGRLAQHLRGLPPDQNELPPHTPSSAAEALAMLRASRQAMIAAIDGVDEESFYRLTPVGHEEYSVISLLENLALHDREHGPQIEQILSATS